jgi:hypothetical protein
LNIPSKNFYILNLIPNAKEQLGHVFLLFFWLNSSMQRAATASAATTEVIANGTDTQTTRRHFHNQAFVGTIDDGEEPGICAEKDGHVHNANHQPSEIPVEILKKFSDYLNKN